MSIEGCKHGPTSEGFGPTCGQCAIEHGIRSDREEQVRREVAALAVDAAERLAHQSGADDDLSDLLTAALNVAEHNLVSGHAQRRLVNLLERALSAAERLGRPETPAEPSEAASASHSPEIGHHRAEAARRLGLTETTVHGIPVVADPTMAPDTFRVQSATSGTTGKVTTFDPPLSVRPGDSITFALSKDGSVSDVQVVPHDPTVRDYWAEAAADPIIGPVLLQGQPEPRACPECGRIWPAGVADFGRLWMWSCQHCLSTFATTPRERASDVYLPRVTCDLDCVGNVHSLACIEGWKRRQALLEASAGLAPPEPTSCPLGGVCEREREWGHPCDRDENGDRTEACDKQPGGAYDNAIHPDREDDREDPMDEGRQP